MSALLLYMVKTSVYLAVFYIIYFLFLSRDTMYARNRSFIILSLVSSFFLPLITVSINENGAAAYFGRTLSEIIVTATGSSHSPDLNQTGPQGAALLVIRIYITGVILFGIKLISDIISLLILITKEKNKEGNLVRINSQNSSAFSAFGHIFINDSLSEEEAHEIIKHEMNHLKYYHFIDLILIEVLKVFQWFNPFVHMMNRSLRSIHEFQADEDYLRSGIPVISYQTLLLNHIFKTKIFIPSNNFSSPTLIKKRMIMMTKRRSGRLANLKLLIVLPVAAVIMLIFSACNNSPKSAAANPEAEKTVIYNKVDELPVYNGGDSALLSFLGKNIIYPESAKTNKIQGKVVVKFCITDMGKVDQVSIQTGVDPALDNEAIRVVKSLPDWTPGKKDGKNVNVWYAIPITFKLQ